MTEMVSISDCLKRLKAGEVVTLEVWKYDKNRKTGGDIDTFQCQLLIPPAPVGGEATQTTTQTTKPDATTPPLGAGGYTRQVRIFANGHPTSIIRTIHPPLIKSLNGIETVI